MSQCLVTPSFVGSRRQIKILFTILVLHFRDCCILIYFSFIVPEAYTFSFNSACGAGDQEVNSRLDKVLSSGKQSGLDWV